MKATRLVAALLAVYVVLETVGLVLMLRTPARNIPADEEQFAALDIAFAFVLLAFTLVGALIASRRPRHPVGWLLLALGLLNALWTFALGYAREALVANPGSLPAGEAFGWLSGWVDSTTPTLVVLLLLLFPDGSLPSRRWRLVIWALIPLQVAIVVDLALTPGRVYGFENFRNPLGVEGAGFLRDVDLGPATVVLIVAAVVGLFVKRRRGGAEQRQQMKWLLFSASLISLMLVLAPVLEVAFEDNSTGNLIGGFVFALLFTNIAGSIAIAVLKHRLYDIDLVIRRTLVYGVLTATLAGAYVGGVLLLQLVLSPGSDFAIAGSTLAVAALVRPARRRIQELVDRRFYRRKYDAAHTIEAFGARLRDEVELDALSRELRDVVHETMQPAHASLWLRAPEART